MGNRQLQPRPPAEPATVIRPGERVRVTIEYGDAKYVTEGTFREATWSMEPRWEPDPASTYDRIVPGPRHFHLHLAEPEAHRE